MIVVYLFGDNKTLFITKSYLCKISRSENQPIMVIEYSKNKQVKCYRDFVIEPDNFEARRAFNKTFGKELMEPAKKLHDRLKQFPSAGDYNKVFGKSDNRIELKKGEKENEPLILKTRINVKARKFFQYRTDREQTYLLVRDWDGDFSKITTIFVIAVNNHDYNKV